MYFTIRQVNALNVNLNILWCYHNVDIIASLVANFKPNLIPVNNAMSHLLWMDSIVILTNVEFWMIMDAFPANVDFIWQRKEHVSPFHLGVWGIKKVFVRIALIIISLKVEFVKFKGVQNILEIIVRPVQINMNSYKDSVILKTAWIG